jgi:hypothetical protein
MVREMTRAEATITSADSVTLRNPKRLCRAAANGAISPNRMKRIDSAEEISAADQPNSFCNGTMNTPGAPTVPAVITAVRKVTPTVTQP